MSATGTAPLWGRWKHTFVAGMTAAPDTELVVELTAPTGRPHTISGFWDGGTRWGARFTKR
jgi:hypothetical protein